MPIKGKQETTEVISTQSYLGTLIIGTIPIIGSIMLYKWSKDSNVRESKRNLCRAYLVLKYAMIIPIIITVVMCTLVLADKI